MTQPKTESLAMSGDVKWTEGLTEEIGYALNDSIDVDWTPTVGAKAVVAMLHEIYPEVIAAPDLYEALAAIAPYLGATDHNDWHGLKDDDSLSMPVKVRVGDLRKMKAALSRAQGASNV